MSDLRPWYAVAEPHEDIKKGRLSEAVFAANLWAVVQGTAPDIYTDPEAFFAKTYLTGGLSKVLSKVAAALAGEADAGDRILSLQTAFGGGKTHALVALWHLAKHTDKIARSGACADLRKLLGDSLPKKVKAVAVFTNETCDATQGRKTPEGVRTRTLWGELALQLGGVKLYRDIEANDQSRSVPQGLFVEIFRQAAPCLILLDELADYCVGASAVEVGNTTLADQTISFAQQLTQAAQQVPGVAVVATLPASHLEVAGSEKGQEILNRLEKRFGRMSGDNTPVADSEIYEVVRRRLFETIGDRAEHERVADAYAKMCQQHRNEVPPEATRAAFKESILAAYPFHPALIDALYLRWGSHSDFQRTRGVLRLLACVVADLWQRRKAETQSQPLIQPCHIRWTLDAWHAALTRLWGVAYESVVAADVTGDKANAALLDEERGGDYAAEKIAQGLACATLLGSFGGQGERAGYSTKDLRVCVGRPGLNWGYTDGALLALEDRSFYLHTANAGNLGKRYWFGTKPTLTKLIVQYRGQFASKDVDAETIERLQEQVGERRLTSATWRLVVDPQPDLPEQRSLTLLVLPPECAYADEKLQGSLSVSPTEQRILELSQKCGRRERSYRNTLLFLLPSPRGLTRLRNCLREVDALEAVKRDYASQLDEEQLRDLNSRLTAANKSVTESLGSGYGCVARVEGQKVVVSALTDTRASFEEHLGIVWKHVVEEEEWVLRKVGPVTLQKVGLIPQSGGIRLKDAIEAFLRYTDKPMITAPDAVVDGVVQACKDKLLGVGRGLNPNNLQKKWCGEAPMLDPTEEGLWIIPSFKPEEPEAEPGKGEEGKQKPDEKKAEEIKKKDGKEKQGPQVASIRVSGNVPLESWSDVFRCFIQPAVRMNAKKLQLGVGFEIVPGAEQKLSVDDPTVKAMKEAARQLGLTLKIEEQSR